MSVISASRVLPHPSALASKLVANRIPIAARGLDTFLRLTNPLVITKVLGQEHMVAAAELLSTEFCRREPLCRILGIKRWEIVPFFTEYLGHIAKQRLGTVALDRRGRLIGAITAEDYLCQFVPSAAAVHPGITAINAYLDQSDVPAAIRPTQLGETYYCGLAAVDGSTRKAEIFSLMVLSHFWHVRALGYRHGFAKVTNGAILRKFGKLERVAGTSVFTAEETTRPADFLFEGKAPFPKYKGTSSLVTWPIV